MNQSDIVDLIKEYWRCQWNISHETIDDLAVRFKDDICEWFNDNDNPATYQELADSIVEIRGGC